ncbi:hypothetical protein [Lentibacillus sediminis]|uniref:hypothetical protein n=1 Tax=Lentibacillus sediminis TaxID=1940529 RepID=UPI000C1BD160|nr:hypothetical protein [Lentibacillus sediminis]
MTTLKRGFYRLMRTLIMMVTAIFGINKNVTISDLLSDGKKVIEFDMQNTNFVNIVSSSARYLGFANKKTTKDLKKDISEQELLQRILNKEDYPNYHKNNADILVLSGNSYKLIADHRNFFHSNFVLIERRLFLKQLLKVIKPLFKHVLLSRIYYYGSINVPRHNTKYMVFKIAVSRPQLTRKYISPIIGVEGFFKSLNDNEVNYAILRWFEELPYIKPGEDIDLLIDDQDAERVADLLNQEPGLIPTDIYSTTGLPGFDYKGVSYYPPFLAKEILDEATLYNGIYRAAFGESYFLSLIYHAVYHKGEKSGIKSVYKNINLSMNPEHNYKSIIREIALDNKCNIKLTLEGLNDYLKAKGWAPPLDTIARLKQKNKWMDVHFSTMENMNQVGLTVFIIRGKASKLKKEKMIIDFIQEEGFDILFTKRLTEKEKDYASSRIRGGNWREGPYKTTGGKPELIIIAHDFVPVDPSREQLMWCPNIDNARVLRKRVIRDKVNSSLPLSEQCNMIHSSDNCNEAAEYITILAPELKDRIDKKTARLSEEYLSNSNFEVIRDLTGNGRRAKVELIKFNGQLAVKKTYKRNFLDFCQREIFAIQKFSAKTDAVPDLLDYGVNYFIIPYYEDSLNFDKLKNKLLPLEIMREVIDTLKVFYENGYALIDFHPGNIIYDKKEGIKFIDFEFLYKYKESEKPSSFEKNFDFAGIPESFSADLPVLETIHCRTYENTWKRFTRLSLQSLLHDSYFIQSIKRKVNILLEGTKEKIKNLYLLMGEKYGEMIMSLIGRIS